MHEGFIFTAGHFVSQTGNTPSIAEVDVRWATQTDIAVTVGDAARAGKRGLYAYYV
jgi:hypothetical protein